MASTIEDRTQELNQLLAMYAPHFRLMAGYISELFPEADMKRIRELAPIHFNGTLEPIYAHYMSLNDIRRGSQQLKAIYNIAGFVLDLQKTLNDAKPENELTKN